MRGRHGGGQLYGHPKKLVPSLHMPFPAACVTGPAACAKEVEESDNQMPMKAPPIRGILEIRDGVDDALLTRLLAAAYASSHYGPFVIAGPTTARPRLQRVLDGVVQKLGVRVYGLILKDISTDQSELIERARSADFVAVSTHAFRTLLLHEGISHTSLHEALARLESDCSNHRLAESEARSRVKERLQAV